MSSVSGSGPRRGLVSIQLRVPEAGRRATTAAFGLRAIAVGAQVLVALAAPAAFAAPPALYHSPGDDGVSGGIPASVPAGSPATLHLYLDIGSTPSAADPCWQGDGDEICGYRLRLNGSGLDLQAFAPANADLLFNLGPGQLDLIGGDFQSGNLGPTKLGDLVIQGPVPGGSLDLVAGDFVDAQLGKRPAAVPQAIVSVPEPIFGLQLAAGGLLLGALARRRTGSGSRHGEAP